MRTKTDKTCRKNDETSRSRPEDAATRVAGDELADILGHIATANRNFLAEAGHALKPVDGWLNAKEEGRDPRHDELYGKTWCLTYIHSMAGLSGLHDALLLFPRTDQARCAFVEMAKDAMRTFERVAAVADSIEVEEAANATAGYFGRWGKLWKHGDLAARAELDADWRRLKESMRSAEDGIKAELRQAVQEAKSRRRDGKGDAEQSNPPNGDADAADGRAKKAKKPKASKPPLARLRKISGIAASEYVIDTKRNEITHRLKKNQEKTYRIALGQSSTIVNRLVHGMKKGLVHGSKSWYEKFTNKDAHDMRRSGGDTRAFLNECIERKKFTGYKLGNHRYADEAQLRH